MVGHGLDVRLQPECGESLASAIGLNPCRTAFAGCNGLIFQVDSGWNGFPICRFEFVACGELTVVWRT